MFYIIDIIGWIGMLLLLTAYFLVSNKRIKPVSRLYQILNLVAAICLIINCFNRSWPIVALNSFWVIIAGKTLWQIFREKRA